MTDQSVLITGCSSGIGYDAAHTLSKRGWQVFATCRKQEDCDRLTAEGLDSFVLDYANENSVRDAVNRALDLSNQQLLGVFNNGAFAIPGAVEDLPRDALRSIFETNLFGQFDLINRVLPSMKKNGQGRVVNCSSVLGLVALKYRGAYNSTKFAMEGLTDTLRLENRSSPIHFSLIEPGPINTKIRENSIKHFERWINCDQSAHKNTYELTIKPRLYATGQKDDRFELPPSAVTEKLIHALESHKPRARYYVTKPTYAAGFLKRVLSTNWLDKIADKS